MSNNLTHKASMVLLNGNIHTIDPTRPLVKAMAIGDGRILKLGFDHEMNNLIDPEKTFVIDLKGQFVMPGFVESHGHLSGIGQSFTELSLNDCASEDEVIKKVAKRLEEPTNLRFQTEKPNSHFSSAATDSAINHSRTPWLVGRGWNQELWPNPKFPDLKKLSALSGEIAIALTRIDGHALWVNQKALQLSHINSSTPDPTGGAILKDSKGNPTGILIDNAMNLVQELIPAPHPDAQLWALQKGINECLRLGITTFHDACCSGKMFLLLQKLLEESKLHLRVHCMMDGQNPQTLTNLIKSGPLYWDPLYRLSQMSLKLYADGALGSCGAALHKEYCNQPGHTGLMLLTEEEIYQITLNALKSKIQVCTHAIGDRANTIVLNAYERALKEFPPQITSSSRLRVEHAELLSPKDIPRFKKLGVLASIQATHCTSDMPWIENRLSPARAQQLGSPWRALLDSGAMVLNGSDAPIESLNPFWGLYSSITRQDHDGHPPEGWVPSQRMTLNEAINTYTINGAYGCFLERQIGQLQVGKWADFIILEQNLYHLAPKDFLNLKVGATILAGQIVHQDPNFSL
jgi:predicted amidohydrolase YtcJ